MPSKTRTNMKKQDSAQDSLPQDVALKIISCLEVVDVCSLGCCSKFWRKICESDYVWKCLCKERWPGLVLEEEAEINDDQNQEKASNFKDWRGLYLEKHNEMVQNVAYLNKSLRYQAVYVNDYLDAIEDMKSMQFGYKDVKMLLLQPKIHVLLNWVGVHYCIKRLDVQVGSLIEAISSCKIQDRQVDIRWWRNGGWLQSRCFSLKDLTTDEGEKVLRILEQGSTRELVRIHISAAKPMPAENKSTLVV